jgi:hypothetical protein
LRSDGRLTYHPQLMCSRLHLLALAVLLVAALQSPRAESRTAALQVRVNVVRACSVDTRGAADRGTIALTCSRSTAAGAVSTGAGPNARVVPVPARQTTMVPTRSAIPTGPGATTAPSTRQVVTLNF